MSSDKPAVATPSLAALCGAYVSVARPNHWFKNVFMLPGAALALLLADRGLLGGDLLALLVAVAATCCIASANYTINEWLDAAFDRHHPVKRERPSAAGRVSARGIYLQWLALTLAGLALAASVNGTVLTFTAALWAMGLAYNVEPLRTKDRPYLDVLSESVNNPLRFLIGWAAIIDQVLPPSSVLLAYWMGGAYLMAIKRYAEVRFLADRQSAALYRRSFRHYTEADLLVSAVFYAVAAGFFLGVFLIKYRIEFLVAIPFLALLFAWYLRIGMRANSVTQHPEKLYREKWFLLYVGVLCAIVAGLFVVDLPWLSALVDYHVMGAE